MPDIKGRILIVEDETVVALDINYSVRDLNYDVLGPVTSAESAIALLEKDRVDLVLMDIHLKGRMTGIEAAGIIRERFNIPVVFLTAYADESTLLQARTVEPYGYLLKPFTKRELSSNIEIALYKHHAEAKIRASEQRWTSLVTNAPNIIVIVGPDGKLQYSNKYPMSPEQLREVDIFAHILPEYHELTRAAIQKGLLGETFTYEVRAVLPQGDTVWFESHVGPIYDREQVVAVAHISTDITARKLADAERERLIKDLAAKNDELDRFAYTVSHDLRAPLTTIRGFINFLEKDLKASDFEKTGHDIRRINSAVDKMNQMLTDLLELSRVGRLMNQPVEVSLRPLIDEALEAVHGRLSSGNIRVEIDENLPQVRGDRQRLVEVFQNLLDNSAKYMGDQPAPCIRIGVGGYEDDMPVLYVRDNGIGIDPAHHHQIFELFGKLDTGVEGTGIGLSLVKKIVEYHGGRVWVESRLGEGAAFHFTLPSPGSRNPFQR